MAARGDDSKSVVVQGISQPTSGSPRYLNEKPSEIDLDIVSKEVGEKWRSLLTHLGIPLTKIKSLFEDNRGNTTSTCFDGLHFWREGNEPCKPATWSVLLTALEKGAEKKDYACTRREELLSKESSTPSNQGPTSLAATESDVVPRTTGQPTLATSTIEDRPEWKKFFDVHKKKEVCLPVNVALVDKYSRFMGELENAIDDSHPKEVKKIRTAVRELYNRLPCRLPQDADPIVGEQPREVFEFISKRSTPYEIFLIQNAISNLDIVKLKTTFEAYKLELAQFLEENLEAISEKVQPLMQEEDLSHMAVELRTNPDELPLSRVIKLKDYFCYYLELSPTLFEGFQKGCTLLFFAISRAAAALSGYCILSHLAQLRMEFDVTKLIVFGHFAVDLEAAANTGPHTGCTLHLLDIELYVANAKLKLKDAELKATQEKANEQEKKSIDKMKALNTKEKELQSFVGKFERLQDELAEKDVQLNVAKTKSKLKDAELKATQEKADKQEKNLKKEVEMYKKSTVQLAEKKSKLEKQIDLLRGGFCQEHIKTIDDVKEYYKKVLECIGSCPQQLPQAVVENMKEGSAFKLKMMEEEIASTKEKLSTLQHECHLLQEIAHRTKDERAALEDVTKRMDEYETTVKSLESQHDAFQTAVKVSEEELDDMLAGLQQCAKESKEVMEASMTALIAKQKRLKSDEHLATYQAMVEWEQKRTSKIAEMDEDIENEHEDDSTKLLQFTIMKSSIGRVIGKRGKTIEKIKSETGTKISINPEGLVYVVGQVKQCKRAQRRINAIIMKSMKLTTVYSDKKHVPPKVASFLTVLDGESYLKFVHKHNDLEDSVPTKPRPKMYYLEPEEKPMIAVSGIAVEQLRNYSKLESTVEKTMRSILHVKEGPPYIEMNIRFGRVLWLDKSNDLTSDRILNSRQSVQGLEEDGSISVASFLGKTKWSFENELAKSGVMHVSSWQVVGEAEMIHITFKHYHNGVRDKRQIRIGCNRQTDSKPVYSVLGVRPYYQKDMIYDCVYLEGQLDLRLVLSHCGEVHVNSTEEFYYDLGRIVCESLTVDDDEDTISFHGCPPNCEPEFIRHVYRKLYLISHNESQFILSHDEVTESVCKGLVSKYTLENYHQEFQLWNAQWMADFALLAGKDWREEFMRNSCDVSKLKVQPKKIEIRTLLEELRNSIQLALQWITTTAPD